MRILFALSRKESRRSRQFLGRRSHSSSCLSRLSRRTLLKAGRRTRTSFPPTTGLLTFMTPTRRGAGIEITEEKQRNDFNHTYDKYDKNYLNDKNDILS